MLTELAWLLACWQNEKAEAHKLTVNSPTIAHIPRDLEQFNVEPHTLCG